MIKQINDQFELDEIVFDYWLNPVNSSVISFIIKPAEDIMGNDPDIYYEGSVKFDGCMNWRFAGEGYQHLCSIEELYTHTRILMQIHKRCMSLMENK